MFLHITQLLSAITIHYPTDTESLVIEEDIIDNQICTGYFKAVDADPNNYSAVIVSEEDQIIYFNKETLTESGAHFSFNNNEPEILMVEIKRKVKANTKSFLPGKIVYKFESDFDTFNKEVAKNVRVEPAVEALITLEKLLYEVFVQTQSRREKMMALTKQHGMMVRYVSVLSVITLILMILFSAYQLYAMKKFFKKKKLI